MDWLDNLKERRDKKEGNYGFNVWKGFFEKAGFQDVQINLDRNPKYKHRSDFTRSYYKMIKSLPEAFVRRYLASSIDITAIKPNRIVAGS